jgi:hypothetical protein
LTNVLNEWLNPSDETESETTKAVEATSTTSTMEEKKVKDTSEAFDELFNS